MCWVLFLSILLDRDLGENFHLFILDEMAVMVISSVSLFVWLYLFRNSTAATSMSVNSGAAICGLFLWWFVEALED